MKSAVLLTALLPAGLWAGCASPRMDLRIGDKIIFTDNARAGEFRHRFNVEPGLTGRVVELSRPLRLETP